MADDTPMLDVEAVKEQTLMYGADGDLDAKYPSRPANLHKTLPFHTLFSELFNPLLDSMKKSRSTGARRKVGPSGHSNLSPHEARRNIIVRYIAQWRAQVGDDFYPAMRLIIPEKDRDRAMYGLKEKAIAKILIRVTNINKDSEDAQQMVNWKLPGRLHQATPSTAGDFAGRCYQVLSKRPIRTKVGDMSIGEVNNTLDRLSQVGAEEEQVKIFQRFYRRMNAEEMTWLIRIILRQMKIGATEKTILDIWHADAETLFNISSNLRRVCWELWDPKVRLSGEDTGIKLMQCFQPQLAAFQPKVGSFDKLISKLQPTPDDDSFWIEEKLDGERMQLHMVDDSSAPGERLFGFWSRKAKDYTYLYGQHFSGSGAGALTRFVKDAFTKNVRNIILDGEMITWDMDTDRIVGFGTLKTAAFSEKENTLDLKTGQRPLFRVFDCLYLNDTLLTPYALRERRKALQSAVKGVHRRLEIHPYIEAHSASAIEPELRRVVAQSSEGLVLKNPRSMYRLNSRNDDWIKVKPEYMSEFGEMLDCVVVGGYFGSGHRGGAHSSYLCGLLVNKSAKPGASDYGKCISFFKVGGGMSRDDYAAIRGRTEGKWRDWDYHHPPPSIELGGYHDNRQHERPDQWIHASESVVLECKAASVESSDRFRLGWTLRFPRFKALRTDKRWDQALSIDEFWEVKNAAETEHADKQKEFKIEQSRRKKPRTGKKPLVIAGTEASSSIPGSAGGESAKMPFAGPTSQLFDGLAFYILTSSQGPPSTHKPALEALVKSHGASIVQRDSTAPNLIIVADKRLVKVSSLEKRGLYNIVRPSWILDCVKQHKVDGEAPAYLLPYEPQRHMFYLKDEDQERVDDNVDEFGDAYARDVVDASEMRALLEGMPRKTEGEEVESDTRRFLTQLEDHGHSVAHLKNFMFLTVKIYFAVDEEGGDPGYAFRADAAKRCVRFGGGLVVASEEEEITHVVVKGDTEERERLGSGTVTGLARVVGVGWVERCWEEGTRVDEERFRWG